MANQYVRLTKKQIVAILKRALAKNELIFGSWLWHDYANGTCETCAVGALFNAASSKVGASFVENSMKRPKRELYKPSAGLASFQPTTNTRDRSVDFFLGKKLYLAALSAMYEGTVNCISENKPAAVEACIALVTSDRWPREVKIPINGFEKRNLKAFLAEP